jgi:hypothetical protein
MYKSASECGQLISLTGTEMGRRLGTPSTPLVIYKQRQYSGLQSIAELENELAGTTR